MKKFAVILLITIVAALVLISCNRESCPAYGKADVKNTEHIG